ncbi:MAG: response regulator [Lachnospiraceae bacterium]|nr:response regulator [Lachnospiraceae bacterium]
MSDKQRVIRWNHSIMRLLLTLAVMLLVLLAIGLFLYLRVNTLLNVYMEEQGKKQAETLSEVTSRQFEGELKALSTVASEFTKVEEVSVDAISAMQEADHESRIGVQRVDETPYFGVPYGADTFECIESAIHGEQAISYVQGKGLMFCVPAFRDKNVAYVIYRIYPESKLYSHVGVAGYSGFGSVCIMDREGHVVIPARAGENEEKMLFGNRNVDDGFQELARELFTTGSAATFRSTDNGEQMLFAAEIAGSEFYLKGYVPKRVVQEGVEYVAMLVILVFLILAALVFLGGFLLTRLEIRAQESEQLREASLVAEKSNAAKSDFLANMSHEIRTPINAMLGMNEMIIRESDNERVRNYADNIDSAGKNLLSIINDILDFSKIEAGRMEITEAPYQLSSLLNDVSNMILFRARTKDLEFRVDVDESIPDGLYGDEVRIRQVFVNVLSNAVKYTNEGSVTLRVRAGRLPEEEEALNLIVTVEDTGIGIRQEDIDKLFIKFERVDLLQNRTVEGTGLGLAITQKILQLMGGDIRVQSEYGKGSIFTVTLKQKIVAKEPIGNFRIKFERGLKEIKTYRETFRAKGAKILVVDDTQINLTVIEGLLKKTELGIDTATGGEDALKLTMGTPYDLILMDQRMPKMDGSEAMKRIREQESGCNVHTPVIALTADAMQGARARYLAAGFTDYLSKPVDGHTLETTLVKYLPKEKVVLYEREDAEAAGSAEADESTGGIQTGNGADNAGGIQTGEESSAGGRIRVDTSPEIDVKKIYENCDMLSYEEAIQYLGTDEIMRMTLEQYYEDIKPNADEIEAYLKAGDIRNYTVKVHALKSSSRLIGATALSEEARKLEEAGNAMQDGEDTGAVAEKTEKLLENYRKLSDMIGPYMGTESGGENADYFPEIRQDELYESYDAIAEFAASFDLDSIDLVMEQLKEYRVPDQEQERYTKLKTAVRDSDWEKITQLTKGE